MTNENVSAPQADSVPWHLWVVGIVALLWNGFGAYDYLMTQTRGVEYLSGLGMTAAQIDYYNAMPAWMSAVWAVGVWGGVLGAVLLLLRRGWAVWAFAASLAALVISLIYALLLSDGARLMGAPGMIMNVVILIAAVAFLYYARRMARGGVLR